MLTVKDFARCAHDPVSIVVIVGETRVDLVNEDTGKLDEIIVKAFGDYVVDDFKANKPNEYGVWVAQHPIKINEV